MYVRVTTTPNSPRKSVKVVESVREGFKVKQVMLHHVGVASDETEIEKLKQLGREFIASEEARRSGASGQLSLFEEPSVEQRLAAIEARQSTKRTGKPGPKPRTRLIEIADDDRVNLRDMVEEQRIVEGLHDVGGHVYQQLGYDKLLRRKVDQELLRDIVLMRLAEPASKLKSQSILAQRFARTHNLDAIYRMMDKLEPQIGMMKMLTYQRAQQLLPESIDVLFFDCTTLYFESTEVDDLRRFGYSKDHRFNTTQVVLALATNSDGLPLGYELFEGNRAEVRTLTVCLENWQKQFQIGKVCFVADRAMMSDANLKLLESKGYQYVVTAKLRSLPAALKESLLAEENYRHQMLGEEVGWIGEFEHQERRLVVSYKTIRARRDARQREQVINKLSKVLGTSGETKKLISNQGVKKFTTTEKSKTVLDENKIAQDAAWDGMHGVITNIKDSPAGAILQCYGRLWKIEESFRLNKHTLSMRPIYHFKPERIHAHIAICYMAFSVLRHLEYVVGLTQKITPQTMLTELMEVQASILRHTPTGKQYRLPSKFSHNASRIYRAFKLERCNHAQAIILK